MDRRYQIFVSSTFEDLKLEREGVLRALLDIDCFPASMEGFGAASITPWDIITSTIDLCDYYLVITAGKYGSENEGVSYTEREYDYAKSLGIPCLAFIHSDPDNLPNKLVESDVEKKRKLESFRAKLAGSHLLERWSNIDNLKYNVIASLTKEMKRNPRAGWVRASEMLETETLRKLEDLRSENEDLRARLQRISAPEPEVVLAALKETQITFNVKPEHIAGYEVPIKIYFEPFEIPINGLDYFKAAGSALYGGGSSITVRKAIDRHIRQAYSELSDFLPEGPTPTLWTKVIDLAREKVLMIFDRYELIKSERIGAGEDIRTQWSFNDFGRRVYAYSSI